MVGPQRPAAVMLEENENELERGHQMPIVKDPACLGMGFELEPCSLGPVTAGKLLKN